MFGWCGCQTASIVAQEVLSFAKAFLPTPGTTGGFFLPSWRQKICPVCFKTNPGGSYLFPAACRFRDSGALFPNRFTPDNLKFALFPYSCAGRGEQRHSQSDGRSVPRLGSARRCLCGGVPCQSDPAAKAGHCLFQRANCNVHLFLSGGFICQYSLSRCLCGKCLR